MNLSKKHKSYCVCGGAGFVGSHLVMRLLKDGNEVAILDHNPKKSPFYDNPDVKIINVDTRELNKFPNLIEDYDVVVHLAGHIDVRESIENPLEDADNNIMGAINVLEACRKHKKIAIFASSAAVYGKRAGLPLQENASCIPISPYGQSKYCAENYFRLYHSLYNVRTVSLRILNIAGPLKRKGVFYNFADALVNGKPITIYGTGEQSRDMIPIGDVVDAIIKSVQTKSWGQAFNIGTGKPTTINQLLKMFKEFGGKDNHVFYKERIKGEIRTSYADIKKANEVLDWHPKAKLEDEIGRIMEWFKNGADNQAWKDLHGLD